MTPRNPRDPRIDWQSVLRRAKQIVESYDTGVTLRQLFYRLVSEELIPNKQSTYNSLSSRTAQARRDGWFPDLVDRGRKIQRYQTFQNPAQSLSWLHDIYQLDRTIGQKVSIYIGVEKNGLLNLLVNWFGDLGLPVIALSGYSSQTFCDDIVRDVASQKRPSVLIYGGDFDPSGVDILRDFKERTDCWDRTHRIALNPEHIERYNLPPLPGKASDSRAAGFIAEHGELIQVELDALPPDILQGLYAQALRRYWNPEAYDAIMAKEEADRETLRTFIESTKKKGAN